MMGCSIESEREQNLIYVCLCLIVDHGSLTNGDLRCLMCNSVVVLPRHVLPVPHRQLSHVSYLS